MGAWPGKPPPLGPVPVPRAHSLGGVDPDDVQVAVVDALLVLVGEARTAPGPATRRAPLGRRLPSPTWPLLLPGASGTLPLRCHCGHSLLTAPLRSGRGGGLVSAAPASVPRLEMRHHSCRGQIEGPLSS